MTSQAKAGEVSGSATCSASRSNSCCNLLAADKAIEGVGSLEQLTKFDILRLLMNLPEHLQSCW